MQERFKKFLKRFRIYWVIRRRIRDYQIKQNIRIIEDLVYWTEIKLLSLKIGTKDNYYPWGKSLITPTSDSQIVIKEYKVIGDKGYAYLKD